MKYFVLALALCVALVQGHGMRGRLRGSAEDYRKQAKPVCRTAQADGTAPSVQACPFADPQIDDLYVCDEAYTYTRDGVSRTICRPRECETDADCQNPFDPTNNSTCYQSSNRGYYYRRQTNRPGRCIYSENIRQYASACQVRSSSGVIVSTGECMSCYGSGERTCDTNAAPTVVTIAGENFNLYFCAAATATNNNGNNNNNNNGNP